MSNVQQTIKRNAYAFGAGLFLLAATIPSIIAPQLASAAAQITERSIQMSSSTTSLPAQTYQIKFTTATESAIQGVAIDFCDSGSGGSPIIGSANCVLPVGMTVGTTIVGTVDGLDDDTGWAAVANQGDDRTLTLTNADADATISADTDVTIEVSGFTNPSAVGTFYARILTFETTAFANGYTSVAPGTYIDGGGVALSTTQTIGVTATVQESLTFCVAGATIADNCAGISTEPNIVLGTGNPKVLDADAVYTGNIFYQLSTNASGTTNVRIKGASGGLTSGLNSIPALVDADVAAIPMLAGSDEDGAAAFGIKSAAATGDAGTLSRQAPYDNDDNYGNNETDITSTYGSIISHATGAVLNQTAPLTFGATAGPSTPAGVYTGSFSLIASSSY